jgi:hypothetical protein
MVPRGRIELPTPAFSGPRSTDELPRHGDNQRFYGKGAGVKRENAWADWARRFESQATTNFHRDGSAVRSQKPQVIPT